VLGYSVEQWTTQPGFWLDHVHPDDREEAARWCARAATEGGDHGLSYRAVAADGRAVWLRDMLHVSSDEQGAPVKLRGVMFECDVEVERDTDKVAEFGFALADRYVGGAPAAKGGFRDFRDREVWTVAVIVFGVAVAATVAWGLLTGHGAVSGGASAGVTPFNASWQASAHGTLQGHAGNVIHGLLRRQRDARLDRDRPSAPRVQGVPVAEGTGLRERVRDIEEHCVRREPVEARRELLRVGAKIRIHLADDAELRRYARTAD